MISRVFEEVERKMKIIRLFLLITFVLYAEFNLNIPNDVSRVSLEKIVKNGWNDSNESLSAFIIKHAEKVMPIAMQKIKKPLLTVLPSENNKFPTPEILLTTDDFLFILSYVKYLEYQGETDEALSIYLQILKGLDNIDDKSILSVILKFVFQEKTVLGLNNALHKNIFSEDMKKRLKSELKDLLILDTKAFFIALEGEKEFILKAHKASIENDENTTEEHEKLTLETENHLKTYVDLYFGKMHAAMIQETPQALDEFEVYMDKEREEISSLKTRTLLLLYYGKVKIKNLLMIGNESYGMLSKLMGQTIALVGIPRVKGTYLDYLGMIENNKKFLNSL